MAGSRKFRLTLRRKRQFAGYIFCLPFILGVTLFFAVPIVQSVIFSLSELKITHEGFTLTYVGVQNYRHALFVDAQFVRILVESMSRILVNIPVVLIFAFFAANLLNQRFKGRTLARTVFFLPVILSSGVIVQLAQADLMHEVADTQLEAVGEAMLAGRVVIGFLQRMKLPMELITYIIDAISRMPESIEAAAIPILVFLAGLQGIPSSLYEAASIEGATGWEFFWKVTFPLLSPLCMTNIVYIIVDSFTSVRNPVVTFIANAAWGGSGYGVSVAMVWIYFTVIFAILGLAFLIIGRRVVYIE